MHAQLELPASVLVWHNTFMARMFRVVMFTLVAVVLVSTVMLMVRGDEESTWLCRNGVWVAHGNPSAPMPTEECPGAPAIMNEGSAAEKADKIRVVVPQPGMTVTSPLISMGDARGTWYFEASFPVELRDADGNVIAGHYATAEGEWMTEDFVPFTSTLEFPPQPPGAVGVLVLKKDNPSGLPEHDDELRIPVRF